jgi:hypothetical protein
MIQYIMLSVIDLLAIIFGGVGTVGVPIVVIVAIVFGIILTILCWA